MEGCVSAREPRSGASPWLFGWGPLLALTLSVATAAGVPAEVTPQRPREETAREAPPPVRVSSKSSLTLFPSTDLYPFYLADPHAHRFGVQLLSVSEPGIADSGSSRFALQLGGRFGVLRVHPQGRPDRGWQLGIEVGFYGQFDNDHSQDNIGWDGYYGLLATAVIGRGTAVKLGVLHPSAHVGEEREERTTRRRIG